MNRRDFLKLAAALPVASVVPAIALDEAPSLTASALEKAIIDIWYGVGERGVKIAVRPTTIFVSSKFREIVEPILHKHFDDAYASLP